MVLLQNANVAVMDPSGNGTVQIVGATPFAQWDSLPSIMFDQDKVLTLDPQGQRLGHGHERTGPHVPDDECTGPIAALVEHDPAGRWLGHGQRRQCS